MQHLSWFGIPYITTVCQTQPVAVQRRPGYGKENRIGPTSGVWAVSRAGAERQCCLPVSVRIQDPWLGCSNLCEALGSLGVILTDSVHYHGMHSMSRTSRKSNWLPFVLFLKAFHYWDALQMYQLLF